MVVTTLMGIWLFWEYGLLLLLTMIIKTFITVVKAVVNIESVPIDDHNDAIQF